MSHPALMRRCPCSTSKARGRPNLCTSASLPPDRLTKVRLLACASHASVRIPRRKQIVTGAASGHLYVWHGRNCVRSIRGHHGFVSAMYSGQYGLISGGEVSDGGRERGWIDRPFPLSSLSPVLVLEASGESSDNHGASSWRQNHCTVRSSSSVRPEVIARQDTEAARFCLSCSSIKCARI